MALWGPREKRGPLVKVSRAPLVIQVFKESRGAKAQQAPRERQVKMQTHEYSQPVS